MPIPCWLPLGCLNLASEQGTSGTAEGSLKLNHQPGLTAGAAGPPSLLQCLQACKDSGQDELGRRPGALVTNRRLYARKQRNEGTSVCATQNILGYVWVGKRRRKYLKTGTAVQGRYWDHLAKHHTTAILNAPWGPCCHAAPGQYLPTSRDAEQETA